MATACSSSESPSPRARLVGQVAAYALVLLLFRLLTVGLVLVPGAVPLDPGPAFAAWAWMRCGAAVLPLLWLVTALTDLWSGLPWPSVLLRALGALLLYLAVRREAPRQSHAWFWGLAMAPWTALGPEILRWYPFTYVFAVSWVQTLLWCLLLQGGLTWRDLRRPAWVLTLLQAGLVLAAALFWLDSPFWPAPRLGFGNGRGVRFWGFLLGLLPLLPAVIAWLRTPEAPRAPRAALRRSWARFSKS